LGLVGLFVLDDEIVVDKVGRAFRLESPDFDFPEVGLMLF
jgi:hypothetical protein